MNPQTVKQRKAAERQRNKDAGLVRMELWVHPRDADEVKRVAWLLGQKRLNLKLAGPRGQGVTMTKDATPREVGLSEGLGAWLPTAERLPAPETDVLALVVFGATVRMTVAGHFQAWADGPWGWYSYEQPERELQVTHWQPLPKLPRDIPGICGAGLLQAHNTERSGAERPAGALSSADAGQERNQ